MVIAHICQCMESYCGKFSLHIPDDDSASRLMAHGRTSELLNEIDGNPATHDFEHDFVFLHLVW